jgi:hypothetical protein
MKEDQNNICTCFGEKMLEEFALNHSQIPTPSISEALN